MKALNQAMMQSSIQSTVSELATEMTTAGLIQETVDKDLTNIMPVDTEEVDEITEQVLWEVTAGQMGKPPPIQVNANATGTGVGAAANAVGAGAGGGGGGGRVAVGANGDLMAQIDRM